MSARRPVKVDERFLELLDQPLPAERDPSGEPSATDFLLVDLPPIAQRFAVAFDELMTPIPDRPDYSDARASRSSRQVRVGQLAEQS